MMQPKVGIAMSKATKASGLVQAVLNDADADIDGPQDVDIDKIQGIKLIAFL